VASRTAATGSVGVPIAAVVGAMLMPFPILGDAGGAGHPAARAGACAQAAAPRRPSPEHASTPSIQHELAPDPRARDGQASMARGSAAR
jgi:hypothetical protein